MPENSSQAVRRSLDSHATPQGFACSVGLDLSMYLVFSG